jgi:DNA-binding SARP family transcriptional activator/tRNA A-37 threonylcarbamoyl transferase component Bud32
LTGGVRVECEGALLDHHAFPWPHAEIVLAYLVAERNRPVSSEEIANAIWDASRPQDWEITVAFVVQKLRNALANSPAEACLRLKGGETPELQTSGDAWVDTDAAAEAIHDAEGYLRAGHPTEAFGPSAVAHHVARRPFLRGEQSRWVQSHRDRLHGILVRALECRGEVFLWNGEFPLAIEAAKEVLSLEPFRETAHRLLIRSHAASGNAAEAKRTFEYCRKLLADELGIEPAPETREAYRSKVRSVDSSSPATRPRPSGEPAALAAAGADLEKELQRLLGHAYDIKQELAAGGMSRVFLAEERALSRLVVIKVLPPDMAEMVSAERFAREVRIAAKLQQANIVPVLTAAVVGGLPYYTMPFVPGDSLRKALTETHGLPISRITSILRDLARALAFAHDQGFVHRDIKPENILLSGDTAVVTDFGIAKALRTAGQEKGVNADRLTRTGIAVGTPQYMAPEQIAGDPEVDHRADIYSFGVVAYELFTGRSPFSGRATREALVGHLLEQPPDLRSTRRDAPASLAKILMRCLEKDPAKRPHSMSVVLAAIDQ